MGKFRNYVAAFFLLVVLSCGKEDKGGCAQNAHNALVPGDPKVLSPENPACAGTTTGCEAKDEDSAILLAQDGAFYVTWMSNRTERNDDIYVIRSTEGVSWDDPIRVTTHVDSDTYPGMIEHDTPRGKFHLVWTRQQTSAPFARHIYLNSSPDGVTWDPAQEVQVTSGLVDDFLPNLIARDGNLHIYFDNLMGRSTTGTRDIFLTRSTDGGSTWSAPEALTINSDTEMDTFAYVAPRPFSTSLMMVWVRYDASATGAVPYLHPSTDLFFATSEDGITFGTPFIATPGDNPDTTVDSIPSIYIAGAQEMITWMKGVNNEPHVMEIQFTFPTTYPTGIVDVTSSNKVPGYSPRVTRTLKQNTYLRTWVGSDKRIYYQVFER
jgi:hypothetical protein